MENTESIEGTMSKERMIKFFETFSSKGYEKAVLTFFAEDVRYENVAGIEYSGIQNVINYMRAVHHGDAVKETITPVRVLIDGDDVAAELLIQLEASIDVPDHVVVPLNKGDKVKHRVSAWYKIRNGRIAHLKVYPPAELTPKLHVKMESG